jgi:L-iditol 2-dehydrogenase
VSQVNVRLPAFKTAKLIWDRIPHHVSLEAAALLEPLSVAIHATKRASIETGDTAIVFGAGTVGLLVAAMAQLSGATNVLIADIDAGRVGYALKHRFASKAHVVPVPERSDMTQNKVDMAKELAAEVVEKAFEQDDNSGEDINFEGADVVFDCTGKEICVQAGLYVSS